MANAQPRGQLVIVTVFGIFEEQYFGIDTLIAKMLAEHRPITRYLMDEYWLDIGQIDDYSEAERAYQVHFKNP